MSLKFISVIFLYFVFIQSSSAFFQLKDFQTLLGGCPNKKGVTNFDLIKELNGKWYTHLTTGKCSPWNYLQCQSHEISISSEDEPITIQSQFRIPKIPINIPLTGEIQVARNGQFDVTYYNPIYGNFHHKLAILGGDIENGVITWACIDFKYFHLETTMAMSKSKNLDEQLKEQLKAVIEKFGITESLTQIDQKNCKNSLF